LGDEGGEGLELDEDGESGGVVSLMVDDEGSFFVDLLSKLLVEGVLFTLLLLLLLELFVLCWLVREDCEEEGEEIDEEEDL